MYGIKNVFCAYNYSIILTKNNEILVCGENSMGQLGFGNNKNINIYTKIDHTCGIIKNIYCGRYQSIILNEDNEMFISGSEEFGNICDGNKTNKNTYTKLELPFDIFNEKYIEQKIKINYDEIIEI